MAAASYAPTGAVATLQNGSSLVSTLFYDKRLQPCRISIKKSGNAPGTCADPTNGNVLDMSYNFNLGTADNGNVYKVTNNITSGRSINYTYDALNRIAAAYTDGNLWGETFQIDPWGNLNKILAYTGKPQPENLNQMAGVNNRFTGMSYDASGNLQNDGASSYTYDAESRIATGAGVTYTYDGDGKRVQKSNGKLYWYGAGSDPVDETDATGSTSSSSFKEYIFFGGKRIARRDSSNNVVYYFADHLGTARVVTDAAGNTQDDSDFCPFGKECYVVASSSGNTYKFTGKERDSESGLDDFGARHYTSALNRFMQTDPFNIIHDSENREHFNTYIVQPQNWNRYAYTWNNPLRYVDPTGELVFVVMYTIGNESGDDEFKKAALTQANEIINSKGFNPKYDTVLVQGVNSFEGFKDVINTANGMEKRFGKVGEVDLYSHAGIQDGPNFNYGHNRRGHYTNEQNAYGLESLHVNWDAAAQAKFFGCNTANFAQWFANGQHVPTYGFDTFSYPSSSPTSRNLMYKFGFGSNMYWVTRDGRPPVRKDPATPH